MKWIFTLFAGLLIAQCSLASTGVGRFNLSNYHQCRAHWTHCHKTGPYYSVRCVASTAKTQSSCYQVALLAKQLATSIDALSVKPIDQFFLVTQHFYADGQQHYFILTPQNKLVDPLRFTPAITQKLQAKFGQKALYTYLGSPRTRVTSNERLFGFKLSAQQGCLACKQLGVVTLRLIFSSSGHYLQQQLLDTSRKPQE